MPGNKGSQVLTWTSGIGVSSQLHAIACVTLPAPVNEISASESRNIIQLLEFTSVTTVGRRKLKSVTLHFDLVCGILLWLSETEADNPLELPELTLER